MTQTERTVTDEGRTDQAVGAPDWRSDPRETADAQERRATRRRRSRVAAVILAVLLAVFGVGYVGFVTGNISLPVLGTLTTHPADVATFQVGRATYLMQAGARDPDSVAVFRQNGDNSVEFVTDLAKPAPDGVTATSDAARTTYFAVLPSGARDVGEVANDPRAKVAVVTGAIHVPGGSSLVGAVVTLDMSQTPGQLAGDPGLSALRWVDADGHSHTGSITR